MGRQDLAHKIKPALVVCHCIAGDEESQLLVTASSSKGVLPENTELEFKVANPYLSLTLENLGKETA